MTNSPAYDQQLALDAYWKEIGGLVFLPGTNRASDRFARASFFLSAIRGKPILPLSRVCRTDRSLFEPWPAS